jgi:hypothetical protein
MSAYRTFVSAVIYELPDLDQFLRPDAVPVIAIALAFTRTAVCAVHSAQKPQQNATYRQSMNYLY